MESKYDNIDVVVDSVPSKKDYKKWCVDDACKCKAYIDNNTAHLQYGYSDNIGTWFINTAIDTYPKLAASVTKLFPGRNFENGADIGCGSLTFFDYLKVENPLLIDITEEWVNHMRQRGYNAVVGDIQNLSFIEDKSIDIIVCSDILEHVLSFDVAMKEVSRIISDDGLLLVNIPSNMR